MTGLTVPHSLPYPDDYNAPADVPADLQALATATETALTAQDQVISTAMPIGAIIAYGGASAPSGWHLCNGTVHGSAELEGLIGSANTPDLRDRFIVGAGNSYPAKATGGAATVALTTAQMPSHSHGGVTGAQNQNHTHGIEQYLVLSTFNGTNQDAALGAQWSQRQSPAGTGTDQQPHNHNIIAEGGNQAHENRPPYYALVYIIRKG